MRPATPARTAANIDGPALIAPSPSFVGAGAILQLIRTGRAQTRAELSELTGLSRSTIMQRVDSLMSRGLIVAAGENASTGGRRSTRLAFNGNAGIVLAADLGARHGRLAIANLGGEILVEHRETLDITDGPESILGWAASQLEQMLADSSHATEDVLCVGIGIPGPVQFATGRPMRPPIMPGWDGFPLADYFAQRFGTDVLVDNDVNVMALGEAFLRGEGENLVFVKVGTGIGMGILAGNQIQRGAQGCAGDIGHVQTAGHDDVLCPCGNRGCLEAVAGGAALAAQLTAEGIETPDARTLVEHAHNGVAPAIQILRQGGRELGAVLATVVNLLNPSTLIIGGSVADAGEHFLAGIRENVYRRSTPLATHALTISRSTAGERAGVVGAAAMCIDHLLSPDAVERWLDRV